MRSRHTVASLLLVWLAGAALAQDTLEISAEPNPAGELDPVTVHLVGIWNDGCYPVFSELLAGVSIPQPAGEPPFDHTWRLTYQEPNGPEVGCPAAVTGFDSVFLFGPLAPGRHGIEVQVIRWVLDDQQILTVGVLSVDVVSGFPERLSLQGGRFEATATWRDFEQRTGAARVLTGASGVSGQLWFFARENPELMVKVLDGCALNGHYWVFSAGATNVEYHLVVTDTATGAQWTKENALGQLSTTGVATSAFPCGD